MEYAQLGRTGLAVSRIGFGGAAIGGADYGPTDDATSIAAVHRALDEGINFFDVADVYGFGHAEEVLGRALRGVRRDVIVATKVGVRWDETGRTTRDLSERWIVEALDRSLERLGLDQIPLYQIHWPDPSRPLNEAVDVLRRQQEAGKIGHIGLCNVDAAAVQSASTVARIESVQVPFSLVELERSDVIRAAAEQDIAVQAYNVLARGLLTGKYDGASQFPERDTRSRSDLFTGERLARGLETVARLRVVAQAAGRSPAQVATRWVAEQPGVTVALTGIKTPEQASENARAFGWVFDRETAAYIASLA